MMILACLCRFYTYLGPMVGPSVRVLLVHGCEYKYFIMLIVEYTNNISIFYSALDLKPVYLRLRATVQLNEPSGHGNTTIGIVTQSFDALIYWTDDCILFLHFLSLLNILLYIIL